MSAPRPDGFVLAGGASRRMGTDKARAVWRGRPMALWVVDALAEVCGRVALVRRAGQEAVSGSVPVIEDAAHTGTHPLFGVAAALAAAQTERVVLAPCDLPQLDGESLRALLRHPGPVVASDGERAHPLVAVLPASWASDAWEAANRGASVHAFTASCARVVLSPERLFNRNRPHDRAPVPVDRDEPVRYAGPPDPLEEDEDHER